MIDRLKADWKKQDWVNHSITFLFIFVSIAAGTIYANKNAEDRAKVSAAQVLSEFQKDTFGNLFLYQGTEQYFRTSYNAAIETIRGWKDTSAHSDEDFIRFAIQASQIVTPPRSLDIYAEIIDGETLAAIEDKKTRSNVASFITFNTSVFDRTEIESEYRKSIQGIIPFAIQQQYYIECNDILDGGPNGLGYKHNDECEFKIAPEVAANVASELRRNDALLIELRQHVRHVQLLILNLNRYRCNAVITFNAIQGFLDNDLDNLSLCTLQQDRDGDSNGQ